MEVKTYRLSDGSKWTAKQVSEALGCSIACARQRLIAHNSVDVIFRPVGGGDSMGSKYKKREYTLTEGDAEVFTGTCRDIANKWGLCESTVYHRLRSGNRSIKIICKRPNNSLATTTKRATPTIKPSELIKTRNFFDPLSRLLLKVC
jgi:hypothetical protein